MNIAHRVQQPRHLLLPGLDDARVGVPDAATPNAAVKSRYFLPFASQTCTPLARSQTIGHEPSASMNVTLRDS